MKAVYWKRLNSLGMIGLLALGLAGFFPGFAYAETDTLNLYNGQVIRGQILSAPGELIRIRTHFGEESSFRRIEMNSRHDTLIMHTNRKIYGQIQFIDPYKILINTDHGQVRVWRWLIRSITFGRPNEMRRIGGDNNNLQEKYSRYRRP